MANHTNQEQAQDALLAKIKETADEVSLDHGAEYAAGVLKTLSEAYAWATAPNNAH